MADQVVKDNPKPNQEDQKDPALEKYRIRSALTLSIVGLALAAVVVIALLIAGWRTGSDVSAVVGLFTTTLGTMVGAFFGLQIGSSGKEEANSRAKSAQKKVDALQSAASGDVIKKAQQYYPQLFK